ncbi:MAG: energy transducer TonB [Muribaculaceae bacterium]|nr:energy transducer TonB [Muribaculaceae bacterium]MDE5595551.1 energy transducer TonB [Muribaculaceae bacterium]MDE6703038.1 energy transducer TonB [Muribaculaceae bacterium]
MAKDVDLSSKEWRDIVFEGKNKEFGAYTLRADSVRRHTKAIVIVLAVAIVGLVLLALFYNGAFGSPEEEQIFVNTEVELTAIEDEYEEEIEEEEQFELPPEPEEIIAPEEVANEQQVTAILVTEDENFEEDKQVKNQEDVMNNEAMLGTVDVTEGVDDLNKTRIIDQVIAEEKPVEDDKVYNMAMIEQQPEFPGGTQAMYKWLSDHINYPAVAAEEGVQGKVIVEFIVSKTGAVENVRVLRGRHPALDKEAVRVVKAMPKWNPGRNNSNPVKVTYTLPVTFKLQQ